MKVSLSILSLMFIITGLNAEVIQYNQVLNCKMKNFQESMKSNSMELIEELKARKYSNGSCGGEIHSQ